MHKSARILASLTLAALGCSNGSDTNGSTAAGGSGGATSSSATTGTGGATSSSATGGTGGTGGGGGPNCTPPEVACGDVCAVLNADPAHCGACGHDCLGGACVGAKCQPVILAD